VLLSGVERELVGRQVEMLLPRGALALVDVLGAGVVLRVGVVLVRLGGL
jgi:hypothetical protein